MSTMSTRETDLGASAVGEVTQALRQLLADVLTLFVKTKGFHWHVGGRHFRDHHLLLDEQAVEIFAMVDALAERARKIGGTTLRSIGGICTSRRLGDDDREGWPHPKCSMCCSTTTAGWPGFCGPLTSCASATVILPRQA